MTQFLDTFSQMRPLAPESNGHKVDPDRVLTDLIANSRMRMWAPGDPIADTGVRVLIGVATWCGYDMRLLDVVNEALSQPGKNGPLVEVFNTDRILDAKQFRLYVPKIGEVFHTPVVGVWRDGQLTEWGEGYDGRVIVARMFGSSSDEIVQYITEWRQRRSDAQLQRH